MKRFGHGNRKHGTGKNVRESEMRALVRKQAQRAAVSKKTAFTLHGFEVDPRKIERYRREHGLISNEAAELLEAPSPEGWQHCTPPTSPLLTICRTAPSAPLTTPSELQIPEFTARLCQEYVAGSVESGTWFVEGQHYKLVEGSEDALLAFLLNACITIRSISADPKDGELEWATKTILTSFERAVLLQHPDFLPALLRLAYWMSLVDEFYAQVARLIFEQAALRIAKAVGRK